MQRKNVYLTRGGGVYYELFSKFQTINSCSPLGIQASCDYIYIQVSNMRQCTIHYCTMGSEMYEV